MPITMNLDGFEHEKKVLELDAAEVLLLLNNRLKEIGVKAGQYPNSGMVYVLQKHVEGTAKVRSLRTRYDQALQDLGADGVDFDKAQERDGLVCWTAKYSLSFADGRVTMHVGQVKVLSKNDFLTYDSEGNLVNAMELDDDYPREAKIGESMYPIMHVNPYRATAIMSNLPLGLGVEEDEFPPNGLILLMVIPFTSEDEKKAGKLQIKELAAANGKKIRFACPSVYQNWYGLVIGYAEYEIEQVAPQEWAMYFFEAKKLPISFVDDNGDLAPLSSLDDSGED